MGVRWISVWCLFALAALVAGRSAMAGPLDPPAGPIVPTLKTLAEVEPRIAINAANTPGDADSLFRISQSGSYYLTGNLTGVSGRHGIEIAASGVTLDLNGFDLAGVPGSLDGVRVPAINLMNIAVVNGSVRSWGDDGVDLITLSPTSCRVHHVLARGNFGDGIRATGGEISGCSARGNLNRGIHILGLGVGSVRDCTAESNGTGFALTGAAVSNCTAFDNSGIGFSVNGGSTVSGCAAKGNADDGFSASASTLDDCSALLNSGSGFNCIEGCTVTNCTARSNTEHGFNSGGSVATAMMHCIAILNDFAGINVNSGSAVINCTANDNATSGIIAGAGCTITGCTTRSNDSASGIAVGAGSSVIDCTSSENAGDGIVVSSHCQARDNACDNNGLGAGTGAGVNATGSNNVIEGNTCTASDFGVFVAGIRNVIIRNTCSANTTNWNIGANNRYGPIVDITALGAGAVIGTNAAPSTLTSTDANANFSH